MAIVGRPNVGKSTLFNRLVGRRQALVDDTPGVTRDRREGEGALGPLRFTVVDTAGLAEAAAESLVHRMQAQTERAARAADVTLLVVDGETPADQAVEQGGLAHVGASDDSDRTGHGLVQTPFSFTRRRPPHPTLSPSGGEGWEGLARPKAEP